MALWPMLRSRPDNPRRSSAAPTGDEVAAIAVVLASLVLLGLWSGLQLTVLASTGRSADVSIGDALHAGRRLLDDPGRPGQAWGDGDGPPLVLNAYAYWPLTIAALLGWVGVGGVTIRVAFTHRLGSDRRERLGVSTNARLARKRDLEPLIVAHPIEGRLVIGKYKRHLLATENRNAPDAGANRSTAREGDRSAVAVIGPARSGKTANVIAGVLDWQGPAILSSVRDDLFTRTVAARQTLGQVFVFDPLRELGELPPGATRVSWSPLARAGDVSGAMEAAAVLQEAAPLEGTTNATYWSKKGEALLWPVLFAAAIGSRNMADVTRWLAVQDGNQMEPGTDGEPPRLAGEIREILRTAISGGHPDDSIQAQHALAQFDGFWELDPRTRSDIYSTAQTLVQPWEDPYFSHASSDAAGPTIDLLTLMSGRNTLYVVQPLGSTTRFSVVFGGLLGSLLKDQAYKASHHYQAPLPDLLAVIDEAGNTPLQWLPSVASTCAGVGVLLVTVWQSYAQIEAIYQRQAAPLVTNHGTKILFAGISDKPTLDYVTSIVGDEEVAQRSSNSDVQLGAPGRRSIGEATQHRRLLPADVLRQIAPGQGLLIHGTLPPAHITGQRYWEDVRLARIADGDTQALPPWTLPDDLERALRADTMPPTEVLQHMPAYETERCPVAHDTAIDASVASGTDRVEPRQLGRGQNLTP
jgi:type IV secretion system protein VirD4